jgi:hypothetical protein
MIGHEHQKVAGVCPDCLNAAAWIRTLVLGADAGEPGRDLRSGQSWSRFLSTGTIKEQGESVMDLLVERVDVWAATIQDKPGELAEVLNALRDEGANLQSIIARRAPEEPGKGVVFVTPLQGDREIAAAAEMGFNVTHTLHSVRVMGRDRPGIAAELTQKLADAGINLRGFSASVIGTQFVAYIAVDSLQDANQAIEILKNG